MGTYIVLFVRTFVNIMNILVLIYCVVSWIVPPYNEWRMKLDSFMNTFLDPIRRILPNTGMIDLSPIILLLLLQLIEYIIAAIF